jgi:prophage antirepressor-like protein
MFDRDQDYVYYPKEKTMAFATERERHVRVAYNDGQLWYCVCDVAELMGYGAKERTIDRLNCEVRLLRVPHVSNMNGFTNCNCFTKESLLEFIARPGARRDLRSWLIKVVIPQAESQLMPNSDAGTRPQPDAGGRAQSDAGDRAQVFEIPSGVKKNELAEEVRQTVMRSADILEALDEIIIKAALLKREFRSAKSTGRMSDLA